MPKRYLLALVTALVLPPSAGVTDPVTMTGTILLGNPRSYHEGGITEIVAPCEPEHWANGIDGVWFAIGEHQGKDARLRATDANAALQDLDAWFYSDGCWALPYSEMYQGGAGEEELGVVPEEAEFVVVDLFWGANAAFELTILN